MRVGPIVEEQPLFRPPAGLSGERRDERPTPAAWRQVLSVVDCLVGDLHALQDGERDRSYPG